MKPNVIRTTILSLAAMAAVGFPAFVFADAPDVVWVATNGNDSVGLGTEESPFKTIQKGVNEVAVGGTVKIKAGVYDEGETNITRTSSSTTVTDKNRVAITKRVFLEGAGKDVTHIVGYRDFEGGDAYGRGPNAIRCVYVTTGANGGYIKGVTLREGATKAANNGSGYGGAVGGPNITTSGKTTSSFCLIDCVVSNCAANCGGGLDGVTAVRCLISRNYAHSYCSATRFCDLVNCLVVSNRCRTSSYAAVGGGNLVNCTITGTITGGGAGRAYTSESTSTVKADPVLYNCVVFRNGAADKLSTTGIHNSYMTADDTNMLYDPDNGDYRLMAGSVAVGGGLTEHLSRVSLPAGVSPYIPYGGNDIDQESEKCDAGCFQGAVSPEVKYVTISADNGGLSIVGGAIGENVLAPGTSITISEGDTGTRPCIGFTVDGTEYLFENSASVTITADEVEASERGFAVEAIYTKHWYANANAANDNGTGFRPGNPKKMLQSALALASSGDTVHAAPGHYNEGSYMFSFGRPCRAYVKEGVTLVADEGPESTFIIGEPSTEPKDGHGLGLGTNAMSCVYVSKNSHVKGFTLTGGHTDYSTKDADVATTLYAGGGVLGGTESYRETQYVEDCIISNNCASHGGGARAANLIRCRVFENRALASGGATVKCYAYGSIFNKNRTGTESSDSSCRAVTRFVGCTLGPVNLTLDGATTNRAVGAVSGTASQLHGCLFLGSVFCNSSVVPTTPLTYCVFTGGRSNFPTNEGCAVISAATARKIVDSDLRPIAGQEIAVDGWDPDSFANKYGSVSTEFDISGEPRVRNGRPDIGALESDPKPWYAKLLDGKGRNITVTEADNMVTNIANGVTLQDGMAVSLTWASPVADAVRTGHVRVAGEGSLTVTKDGAPYATYTEADGEVEFSFAATGNSAALNFSFEGEGSADVYAFSSPMGMMLILK